MDRLKDILGVAKVINNTPPIMAELFGRQKAKPWDFVKGRRFKCCGGEGRHLWWCMTPMLEAARDIYFQPVGEIKARDLVKPPPNAS